MQNKMLQVGPEFLHPNQAQFINIHSVFGVRYPDCRVLCGCALQPLTLLHNQQLRLSKYVKMFVAFFSPPLPVFFFFSSSFRCSWLSSYISVQ